VRAERCDADGYRDSVEERNFPRREPETNVRIETENDAFVFRYANPLDQRFAPPLRVSVETAARIWCRLVYLTGVLKRAAVATPVSIRPAVNRAATVRLGAYRNVEQLGAVARSASATTSTLPSASAAPPQPEAIAPVYRSGGSQVCAISAALLACCRGASSSTPERDASCAAEFPLFRGCCSGCRDRRVSPAR